MADRAMRLGAYALCMDESGRLLLARISAGLPDAGAWTLPGGGIDHGESPDLAVERELQEETGLLPHAVHGVVGVYSKTYEVRGPHGAFHHVGIVYRVTTSGDPQPEADGSTDLSGWFTREEIGGITLTPLGEFGCSLAWPATTNGGGTR